MRIILALCFISILAGSCSSPSKLYKKGSYRKAYSKALGNLKKGSKDRSDRSILNKAYNEIIKEERKDIDDFLATGEIEDMVEAYDIYDEIILRYDGGEKYLSDDFKMDIAAYTTTRDLLGDDIYTQFKERGLGKLNRSLSSGDKFLSQESYYDLEAAYHFSEGAIEVELDSQMMLALKAGLVNYNINLILYSYENSWEIDRQFSAVTNQKSNMFRQVYYKDIGQNIDCQLDVYLQNLRQTENTSWIDQNFTEQIQEGFDTATDTSGIVSQVPRYITVSGTVRTNRVTRTSQWTASTALVPYGNYCNLNVAPLDAQFTENFETYTTSGDLRAIPVRFKNGVSSTRFQSDDEIRRTLLRDLYNDLLRIFP